MSETSPKLYACSRLVLLSDYHLSKADLVPWSRRDSLKVWIHFYAGNKERAYTALDSVRWILEMEAKENPGDEQAHQYLAMAYAAMGWKDAALAEIARGIADGLSKAWLFAHAGERDAALRHLEQLPATEREYCYHELRLHPHWDPLRGDSRFEKILAVSAPKPGPSQRRASRSPIRNRCEDKENAFFADGMQDDRDQPRSDQGSQGC